MDMNGSHRIPAKREAVWAALNDPDVLKACIPGCESLEKTSDTEMTASVTAKIGPVKAKFKGSVTLGDLNPPESYTITGEGKGGVAGFAKGSADVRLTEAENGTILEYSAKAQVGGKLAQLGSRLIDSTAKKMAADFFSKFSETVGGSVDPAAETATGDAQTDAAPVSATPAAASADTAPSVATSSSVSEDKGRTEAVEDTKVFGGPLVWGLVALGAVVIVLAIAL